MFIGKMYDKAKPNKKPEDSIDDETDNRDHECNKDWSKQRGKTIKKRNSVDSLDDDAVNTGKTEKKIYRKDNTNNDKSFVERINEKVKSFKRSETSQTKNAKSIQSLYSIPLENNDIEKDITNNNVKDKFETVDLNGDDSVKEYYIGNNNKKTHNVNYSSDKNILSKNASDKSNHPSSMSVGIQASPYPPFRLHMLPSDDWRDAETLCLKLAKLVICQCGLACIVFVWALFGALMFHLTEAPHEFWHAQELTKQQGSLVVGLATDLRHVVPEEPVWRTTIEKYAAEHETLILSAVSAGYPQIGTIWTYPGCMLFATSLLTTLGFGAPVPRTIVGRISAIIFAALAERTAAEAKKESIDKVFDEMNAAHLVTTKIVFRTAYFIAKNNRPCTDDFDLLQMQKLNGLDIGVGLHSKRIAMEIICHVSDEMKKRVVKQILGVSGKISVLIDESTTLGSKSTLIVYLKCEVCKEDSPHFLFLDLLELSDQTSKTVAENLLDCLSKYGFEDNYLKENFVAFASDGASVMLGKKSAVAERLLEKYPSLIIWHCMNHRLELALSDAINEVGAVNHFQIFMDKAYSVYSRSPKNQRELAECASGLDQEINKIGKILGTRWVASSFRAVSATWYGYGALNRHFDFAKADKSRNLTERAMYSGLSKRCSSPQFLIDLAIMYDILAELSMLSEFTKPRNNSNLC